MRRTKLSLSVKELPRGYLCQLFFVERKPLSASSPARSSTRQLCLKVRETKQLGLLSLDEALVVPAMTHCRTMCEHDFLSHWDIAGRKPYQRYSDFAYGQHVSEVVFGFDVNEPTDDEVRTRVT